MKAIFNALAGILNASVKANEVFIQELRNPGIRDNIRVAVRDTIVAFHSSDLLDALISTSESTTAVVEEMKGLRSAFIAGVRDAKVELNMDIEDEKEERPEEPIRLHEVEEMPKRDKKEQRKEHNRFCTVNVTGSCTCDLLGGKRRSRSA